MLRPFFPELVMSTDRTFWVSNNPRYFCFDLIAVAQEYTSLYLKLVLFAKDIRANINFMLITFLLFVSVWIYTIVSLGKMYYSNV